MQNQNNQLSEKIQTVTVSEISQGEPPKASAHVVRDVYGQHSDSPGNEASVSKSSESSFDLKNYRDKSGQRFRTWKGHFLDETGRPAETKGGYLKVDKAKAEKSGFFQKAKESVSDLFHRSKEPDLNSEPEKSPEPIPEPSASFREGSHIPNFADFEAQETQDVAGSEDSLVVAQQTVALEETLAIMLFSSEWQLLNRERQGLVNAWARYYEQTGITEMPLWVEMAAAHMVIVTSRIGQPKTKERFGSLKRWFLRKWVDLKTRKSARPSASVETNPEQEGNENEPA